MSGVTRASASGSIHPSNRRTMKHRRSITHTSVIAYNKLPLSAKLISSKSNFRREIKRYVSNCKTMYLPNYDLIELTKHIECKQTNADITYSIDDQGSLIRDIISHMSSLPHFVFVCYFVFCSICWFVVAGLKCECSDGHLPTPTAW